MIASSKDSDRESLKDFIPKTIDIGTTNARLDHTTINVKSINIQTIILSIILVILITITFLAHLKE